MSSYADTEMPTEEGAMVRQAELRRDWFLGPMGPNRSCLWDDEGPDIRCANTMSLLLISGGLRVCQQQESDAYLAKNPTLNNLPLGAGSPGKGWV